MNTRMFCFSLMTVSVILGGQSFTHTPPDTLSLFQRNRNAAIQAVGIDLSLWAYNSYIANEAWAKISMDSFINNIEHGWVMDEDGFDVNQFGHPYQGALVFTAARSQGLEFWQSVPYPILSSFIWEIGFETEYPSINDMITTPLSGITYGEISHRLSLLALSEYKGPVGGALSFIINPSLGLNRLIGTDNIINPPVVGNYKGGISLGGGGFFLHENALLFPRQFLRFHIFYGNPYSNKAMEPFDFFTLIGIVNFDQKKLVNEVYASGILKKLNTMKGEKYSGTVGVFKNFDFMNHDDFKVSSTSIGLGLVQSFNFRSDISLYNELAGSFIILGGAGDTSDDIPDDMRDYHYGPGFSGKLVLLLEREERWQAYLRLKRYLIYNAEELTLSKYENVNLLITGIRINTWRTTSVGLEYRIAKRQSEGMVSVNDYQKDSIFRVYLSYNFGSGT